MAKFEYETIEELQQEVRKGKLNDNLLDWEYSAKISEWLAKQLGQTQHAAVLGEAYQKAINESEQLKAILTALSLSEHEIDSLLTGVSVEEFQPTPPTEAEWEFAARGGNKSRGYTYSGSNSLLNVGWYAGNSNDKTHQVGELPPNELGIHDMSGNVWEWCSDWYSSYSNNNSKVPTGPATGTNRVHRGGSWYDFPSYCRITYRGNTRPGYSCNKLGFRLAFTP